MGDHILAGHPPVPITLRRSARARRISLRVSQLDGRVTLTLPQHVADREALGFAQEKADWIRSHLSRIAPAGQVGIGTVLPVAGQMREVIGGAGRSVVLSDGAVAVPGPEDRVPARLSAWLRILARDKLAAASDHYADRLGRGYSRLTLRDTRSRWGSCSSQGALMYSWRLVLAPPDVLAYVAAHEVAHLAEMNHSPAFWRTVERLHGPYEAQRAWLRREGGALHQYRFGPARDTG